MLANRSQNTRRWLIVNIHVNVSLPVTDRAKDHASIVTQASKGMPTDLPIGNPLSIFLVPLVLPRDIYPPVAAILIVIGYFLHETHKFWEIVEVAKESIYLV